MGKKKDKSVAQELTSGNRSHSHSIHFKEAKDLGIRVSKADKTDKKMGHVFDLVDARIQMLQTRVEHDENQGNKKTSDESAIPAFDFSDARRLQEINKEIRQALKNVSPGMLRKLN